MTRPFEKALTLYGIKEIEGKEDNPAIIAMFDHLGYPGSALKDETSWCAAFANYCLDTTGYLGTGLLTARSFLSLPGITSSPSVGDIVIFWRESPGSWKGHVGFYINETGNYINCLGGNQTDQVKISPYPKSRLLGYRVPVQKPKT